MNAAMPAAGARGRWIPWLFVGFLVVVAAVNGVMIWYALSSWTGLAANQAYDNGLTYNQNLAAARPHLAGSRRFPFRSACKAAR